MIVWLVAALAWGAPSPSLLGPSASQPWPDVAVTYPGRFDRAPVPHWRKRLPGPALSSGSHTERARPVVVGAFIFVGSAAGDSLYMLDRATGALQRTFKASGSVESEPVVQDDRVYFTDTGGRTWCYTLAGELVWSHDSAAPILVRPTLHEGRVYVTNVDDLVVVLEQASGALVWRHKHNIDPLRKADLSLYGAPPAHIAGDIVLVGFSDGTLVGLDAKGGDVRWDVAIGEGRYPDLVAEPVTLGTTAFVSAYFEPLVALDLTDRSVAWSLPIGASAAAVLESRESGVWLLHPGTDGKLRAIDVRTSEEIWVWDSGDDGALSAVERVDAGVLVSSSTGTVTLLDIDKGEQLWRFRPSFILEGVSAPPTVAGRQLLFVTNAGNLYSMLAPKPASVQAPSPNRAWMR